MVWSSCVAGDGLALCCGVCVRCREIRGRHKIADGHWHEHGERVEAARARRGRRKGEGI